MRICESVSAHIFHPVELLPESERSWEREREKWAKSDASKIETTRILMMKNGWCICNNCISVNSLDFFPPQMFCFLFGCSPNCRSCIQSNRSNFLFTLLRSITIQLNSFHSFAFVRRIGNQRRCSLAAYKYKRSRSSSSEPFQSATRCNKSFFAVSCRKGSLVYNERTSCLLVIHLVCTRVSEVALNRQNSLFYAVCKHWRKSIANPLHGGHTTLIVDALLSAF